MLTGAYLFLYIKSSAVQTAHNPQASPPARSTRSLGRTPGPSRSRNRGHVPLGPDRSKLDLARLVLEKGVDNFRSRKGASFTTHLSPPYSFPHTYLPTYILTHGPETNTETRLHLHIITAPFFLFFFLLLLRSSSIYLNLSRSSLLRSSRSAPLARQKSPPFPLPTYP